MNIIFLRPRKEQIGILMSEIQNEKNKLIEEIYINILKKLDTIIEIKRMDNTYTDAKYFKSSTTFNELNTQMVFID